MHLLLLTSLDSCCAYLSASDFQRFCRPCYCWRPSVVDVPAFAGVSVIVGVPAVDDVPAVTRVLAVANFPILDNVPLDAGESCSSSQVMLHCWSTKNIFRLPENCSDKFTLKLQKIVFFGGGTKIFVKKTKIRIFSKLKKTYFHVNLSSVSLN